MCHVKSPVVLVLVVVYIVTENVSRILASQIGSVSHLSASCKVEEPDQKQKSRLTFKRFIIVHKLLDR